MSYKYPDFTRIFGAKLPLEILLHIQDILRSDVKWRAQQLPEINRCLIKDTHRLFYQHCLKVGIFEICFVYISNTLLDIDWRYVHLQNLIYKYSFFEGEERETLIGFHLDNYFAAIGY